MCKLNKKSGNRRIDPCMKGLIMYLKFFGAKTVACCCGHYRYNMTIVVTNGKRIWELNSNKSIPRKKDSTKKINKDIIIFQR